MFIKNALIRSYIIVGFLLAFTVNCFAQFTMPQTGRGTSFSAAVALFGSANWTCVKSLASGACGAGPFVAYLDQACDGVADDNIAVWIISSIAANPTIAKLYFPPGSTCTTSGTFGFVNGGSGVGTSSVTNSVWWGYGASLTGQSLIGGWTFFQDGTHEALIANANIGDTTVTVTDGNVGRFSIGDNICVNGLGLQRGGFPPNQQYFEYKTITNIVGNVVTLNSSLTFDYKANWPTADTLPIQGPAAILKMQPSWGVNIQLFGLTFVGPDGYQFQFQGGRDITATDISVRGNSVTVAAGAGVNIAFNHSSLASIEGDKMLVNLSFYYSNWNLLFYQSSSIINASHVYTVGNVQGWPQNATFTNSYIGFMQNGPTGYGHGVTAAFINTTVASTDIVNHSFTASWLSFSAGSFSIANADSNYYASLTVAVPGGVYAFADSDGTINSSPVTTFTISAIRDNGTTTFFDLSNCSWGACSGSLPTPTCNAHSCPNYVAYPAGGPGTIIQRNKPAASVDMTQFQAPFAMDDAEWSWLIGDNDNANWRQAM